MQNYLIAQYIPNFLHYSEFETLNITFFCLESKSYIKQNASLFSFANFFIKQNASLFTFANFFLSKCCHTWLVTYDLPLAWRACHEPWPGLTSCCSRACLRPHTSADLDSSESTSSQGWQKLLRHSWMNDFNILRNKINSKCWKLKLSLSCLRVQH